MWQKLLYKSFLQTADKLTPFLSTLPGKTGNFFAGRLDWQKNMEKAAIPPGGIWIHAASAGEYEQAKPLVEALSKKYPHIALTQTFFSPSGYVRFHGKLPAKVFYLPLDTPSNARRFLDIVRPQAVFMVKYEFWPFFLQEIGKRHIPLFLISGIFRENQSVWRYDLLKTSLKNFTQFFVQDEASAQILKKHGFENAIVTGDTRFDTVAKLPLLSVNFPIIKIFKGNAPLLIAGSTWDKDEEMLLELWEKYMPAEWKLFLIPHEPTPSHIRRLEKKIHLPWVRYSNFHKEGSQARILIGDTMGLLKYVYRYGNVAYVGGGFGKGVHNILEAAVYGMPVIIGPKYQKFKEARDLIRLGGAFTVNNAAELKTLLLEKLIDDNLRQAGKSARQYVMQNRGATEKIIRLTEKYLS